MAEPGAASLLVMRYIGASEVEADTQLIPQVCSSVPAPLAVTVSCILSAGREGNRVTAHERVLSNSKATMHGTL